MKTIINYSLLFRVLISGIPTIVLGMILLNTQLQTEAIVLIIFGSIVTLGLFLFMPNRFVFTKDSLTIIYFLEFKRTAKWNEIKKIYTTYESSYSNRFINHEVFHIVGMSGRKTFFTDDNVIKTKNTTKLINLYYNSNFSYK